MRDGGEVLVVIGVVLFLAVCAWIARATGADFWVVVEACGKTLVPLVIAGAAAWFGSLRPSWAFLIALPFIYPLWWPVLTNIAQNGLPAWLADDLPWWASNWFKGVTEVLLVAGVGYWIAKDH